MVDSTSNSVVRMCRNLLNAPFAFQLFSLTMLIVLVLGFRPNYFISIYQPFGEARWEELFTGYPITETGFIDNFAGVSTAGLREILVEDENGNVVVRLEPKKRSKTVQYTVKSGESIFDIAHKFGLNVATLNWANKLTSRQNLRVGQALRIPPADGVFYAVQNGDALSSIAKNHNIDIEKIQAYNSVKKEGTLAVGQELFIPGAQKIWVQRSTSPTAGTRLGSIGFKLRRPTQGVLTQGYHKRHFAIDIANRMNTPIYASASGVVVKSSDGWNYGYGKYIVIDHGNDIQTLYAHNNVRKVEVGDEVKTGQLIALMGNTGNVWGPTGIHLHYEVRIRGRKGNPFNYF
jgi:murein DD-endopeptidase MepM/ murein hydrolase activator NlpD